MEFLDQRIIQGIPHSTVHDLCQFGCRNDYRVLSMPNYYPPSECGPHLSGRSVPAGSGFESARADHRYKNHRVSAGVICRLFGGWLWGRCGGCTADRCIEDQDIIDRILAHLRAKEQDIPTLPLLLPRASQLIPGDHLRQGELMHGIKRGCPGVHCIFSLGRARGSRFQVNRIQSAGTPLRNSLV